MRVFLTCLMLASFCPAQNDHSVVRFANGDKLSGKVLSLSLENLVWESVILQEPAEFLLKHVVDLTMPAVFEETPAGHEATLEMTNGDVIRGQLAGLSDELVRIHTWYAGELVFRRVNVKAVKISEKARYVYRGPRDLAEWTSAAEVSGWQFKNDALQSESSGGIAREIDFPEEVRIAFNATWRGAFNPKIIIYSNDITTDSPGGGYEMVFRGSSVHVRKCGTNNWLGQTTNASELRQNEKARIEIRASVKTGHISLYVDGRIVDIWEDRELDLETVGKGLHFISTDNSLLRIANIEVSTWDGVTEDLPERQVRFGRGLRGWGLDENDLPVRPAEEEVPEGRMVLRNGDSIEGEVTGIEDEIISVKTAFADVKFPVARLKNILLKPAAMETPKRYAGDVRATLSDGSRLVFRLDEVVGDTLVGFSQNFGRASFKKEAFKRIEFNIYNRQVEELRKREEW